MNAIFLAIDRLSAGYLGAYGNAWIQTPALDRLACESIVCEHAWSESPRLEGFYRALWMGTHPLAKDNSATPTMSLPQRLLQAGVASALLTDEWAVAENPLSDCFDDLVYVEREKMQPAADDATDAGVEQTHTAACFARIIDWLEEPRGPFFLSCHLAGLGKLWDAPYEFRLQYAEEDDPPPPAGASPPQLLLAEDYDPDALLGITQSYAGEVSALDACIGALWEFLDESKLADDTLLAIFSPRGYPLGEHRRVGPCDEALFGETLHVPLMLRFPDRLAAAVRSQALVTPADLGPTLLDHLGLLQADQFTTARSLMPLVRGEADVVRDRICAAGVAEGMAIRVPSWYFRREDGQSLFAKPDDRWEFNDVADRCPEIAASLCAAADEFKSHLQSGDPAELSPLDEALIAGPA